MENTFAIPRYKPRFVKDNILVLVQHTYFTRRTLFESLDKNADVSLLETW